MNFYIKSFLIFSRIGLFTIGGGYAMVPLIEADLVDKRKWISREDFLDLMALSQTVPGIFAVNIAIFIGYKLRGFWGAFWMALGTVLPSFAIMLLSSSASGAPTEALKLRISGTSLLLMIC